MEFDEERFNGIAYAYRSWPGADPAGVIARYEELVAHVHELIQDAISDTAMEMGERS